MDKDCCPLSVDIKKKLNEYGKKIKGYKRN